MVLAIMRVSGQLEPPPGDMQELSSDDAAVLATLVDRLSGQGTDE